MESAFGVDHGYQEIEKLSLGGAGMKLAGMATGAGNTLRRTGAAQMRGASGFGAGKHAAPVKFAGARKALGQGGMMAGGALKKLGTGMAARPRLAGGLAAGGATAGVAGGGFMAGRMGGDNKKLSQYR